MAVRTLHDLAPDAACAFLRDQLGRHLVQVVGRCRITYQGRAESTLSRGDRLLIYKPDGTLIVHTEAKLKPVNWQPPGCSFQAGLEDDLLVVTATRTSPKEIVRVVLDEIHLVQSVRLEDDGQLDLVGTEDDLQALLAMEPEIVEPGFQCWRRERPSGRGPMDLYGEDAEGRRVVVEVKRRAATVRDAEQLRRYVEREDGARAGKVRGILCAPRVSEKAKRFLQELDLEYRELDWEQLLPRFRTVLPANQSTLGDWNGAPKG